MGLWLEIKEKTVCLDWYCVARAVIELALEKIGIKINAQVEKAIEEHVEKLAELISDEKHFDAYTFYMDLKFSVYEISFDVIECYQEGCEGYVVALIEVEGDINTMKEVAKALIKNMGIDKYLKCE
jgi:phosphosulfolactate phosphohydrolase-like enzyme